MSEKNLVVVAGPTAVGKTSVAIQLARELRSVIVSADSRQIYREMNIGTAKPTSDERRNITHYFVDTHSVAEDYDAARYAEEALAVIHHVFTKHDYVILCGGSGLYIKGACEGFDDMPEVPDEVRADLIGKYRHHGLVWLQEQLMTQDPEAFHSIDIKNPHRLVRALEVKIHSGKSILSFRKNQKRERPFNIIKIGLELPREELYARIDARMDQMIADGLFDEAKNLYPLRHHNALQTVGYQEIFGYMDKAYDLDECIRLLKRNSRRYAKRQLTWFKKDPEFGWFSPEAVDDIIQYIRNGGIKKV
jgi:tRNA dimethylallyltransferase